MGDDGVAKDVAREAILQSIYARFYYPFKGREVIPAIGRGVVFGVGGIFLRDGDGRTKDMVAHWKFLGMSPKSCGEREVIVLFTREWATREILNRFAGREDVSRGKTFADVIALVTLA